MRTVLFSCLLLGAGLASAAVVERVAAVVNDEVIALSEVYELGGEYIEQEANGSNDPDTSARREAELEVLEQLIAQELMVQEMSRLGMDVTEGEVDQALDDIGRRNGVDRARLKQEVERSGLVWSTYREGITQELRQMKFDQVVLQPRISVSDDELDSLYREKAEGAEGGRVLDGIFLPWTEDVDASDPSPFVERLAAAKIRVAGGEDWTQVVEGYPESPYASRSGRMATYQRGELVEALESAAWDLEVGGISDPVVTDGGVFLLRYAEEAPAQIPPMDTLLSQLQMELTMRKIEDERVLWLVQARRRASVEVKLEAP